MKKRTAAIGLSMALGVTLLLSTAFASAQSISPYETYKEAAKNTFTNKNFTMNVQAQISDNGQKLVTVSSVMKAAKDGNESFSGTTSIHANGTSLQVQNFGGNGQMVTKVDGNDTYFVSKCDEEMGNRKNHMRDGNTAEEEQVGKLVMDAMVGDLRNNFVSQSNGDGSNTISLNLESGQIPAVVNGLTSLAIKDGARNHSDSEEQAAQEKNKAELFAMVPEARNLEADLPKLVQDISIKTASLNAQVSADKIITSQTMNVTLVGRDEAGVAHEITFSIQLGLSGLNSTTPDTIDLTGKTVKLVDHKTAEEQ